MRQVKKIIYMNYFLNDFILEPELFQPGFSCEAIYSEDGQYYPCVIEKITDDGKYVVKFKKYGNKDTVSIYYLRESKKIFNNN